MNQTDWFERWGYGHMRAGSGKSGRSRKRGGVRWGTSTTRRQSISGMECESYERGGVRLYLGDSKELYALWPSPIVIVADGPYGLGSFPGDPPTVEDLAEWYRPHIEQWSKKATPQTTLWFWNSELGWATVHPVFVENSWEYRSCHIWNKGVGHIAGNANSLTLRKFPVVTEVCVQYVKAASFDYNGVPLTLKEWLRSEWGRTGLPLYRSNEACGVKNAASRKYLTADHLWYFPPVEMFVHLARFANEHGDPAGRPYFSLDGKKPLTGEQWEKMRAKFHCEVGVNNVWQEPAVRGTERIKTGSKCAHRNQKPLRLLDLIIRSSSDPGDMVWEPFGGLCSVAISAYRLRRRCCSAELLPEYFGLAKKRLASAERI